MNIEMIDIEEPIRLGHVDMIYSGDGGMIVHELRSDVFMISMDNVEHFIEIYEKYSLNRYQLIDVKSQEIRDILVDKYHKTYQFACYQAVYASEKKIDIDFPQNVCIKNLTLEHFSFIKKYYEHSEDVEHLENIITRGHLWGLFEKNELAGFIGIHDEGSMGILEVRDGYQRKGYGYLLEGYLINYFIDQGWVPFCQVIDHNLPSLSLQKKLGLKLSKHLSYWLFD